ncbi:MAG: glycosyltransferase family 2 protein [Acidobacteria bacterium]|nr:glycosyltransferase family 2 protein [Acidobacteriota bacterium]
MNVRSVSVLICTYNRARLLRETMLKLQTLQPPADCTVEILVVDNNSTDNTPLVIDEAARTGPFPVIGLRETRQGKSFALNLGLSHAQGDVIALTDDDVLPSDEWLVRIVDAFRTKEPLTFVFGKVIPRWGSVPPPELLTARAQDIWGPLAIVDYGDEPADYLPESHSQRLPIGANLSFARSALLTIGGWRTDLGKVNNTLISGEDHEIFVRLRRHGLYRGYYDPRVAVRHYVPASRLTRKYFRQWFYWHGKTNALMLADLFPDLDLKKVPRIGGVPRFLYRQAATQVMRYAKTIGRTDSLALLIEELKTLQYVGLFSECWSRSVRRAPAALPQAAPRVGSDERLMRN